MKDAIIDNWEVAKDTMRLYTSAFYPLYSEQELQEPQAVQRRDAAKQSAVAIGIPEDHYNALSDRALNFFFLPQDPDTLRWGAGRSTSVDLQKRITAPPEAGVMAPPQP